MLGRLDAVVDFTSPMWKDSLRFMEPNLCGVGGLHMGPTCEQLLADVALPAIQQYDAGLQMEVGQDLREMFIQEVFDHLQAIGRAGHNVCFVEPKYSGQGPDEQEALAQYYHERHGLKVMHADPRELTIVDGEVLYEGVVVDIAYRDYEVRDLIQLETEEDVDVEPIRLLFRENRMILSMAGDFDHKSCWELLTDRTFNKYFTAEERQIFRRHILWTRVLGGYHDIARRRPGDLTGISAQATRLAGARAESFLRRRSRGDWASRRPGRMGSRNRIRHWPTRKSGSSTRGRPPGA